MRQVPRFGTQLGVSPSWFGYRYLESETIADYCARHGEQHTTSTQSIGQREDASTRGGVPPPRAGTYVRDPSTRLRAIGGPKARIQTVHAEKAFQHPLPGNIEARSGLPREQGWWGYSFWDVPNRTSGPTRLVTLPHCRVVWYHDRDENGDFYPALLPEGRRSLELREIRFRPKHAAVLRGAKTLKRLERATWILERVYHNHSHWLTAHLPKVLLLRAHGGLKDVLLPLELTPTMEGSLRLLGLDPDQFPRFDPTCPLDVDELTIVENDRFRPELLCMVRDAFAGAASSEAGTDDQPPCPATSRTPWRRVYVSRARATRRRLENEVELWPFFERAGFERVLMEDLSFEEQVRLLQETAVLAGPHGAGLTNMIFCPPGAHVIEIADLGFPNPNFYALASGLRHHYWIVQAQSVGTGHPLERDLRAPVSAVDETLARVMSKLEGR